MEDKDVGELWKVLEPWRTNKESVAIQTSEVDALIRKLVEERARRHLQWGNNVPFTHSRQLERAQREFGIDPASWNMISDFLP